MDEQGGVKLTGIRQIVKLKEFLQKWQSTTLGSKEDDDSLDAISKSIHNVHCVRDLDQGDEDSSNHGTEPPPDVPEGYLAVYVGQELRRFIIPTSYLTHQLFKVLLEKAEEEFGFQYHDGGLTIPCDVETFKFLLKCIEKENQQGDEHENSLGKQEKSDECHAEAIEV